MNEKILDAVRRSDAIPSMPQIVTRLLEITKDPNYEQKDVVSLLSTDPGVASDVLRLANSALFGVTRKVGSLNQAVALLGMKRVRTMVVGRCMADRVNAGANSQLDSSYYWRRSVTTAALSAQFADQVIPQRREEAFMSGLLSDIGVVVLAKAFPTEYGPVAESYSPLNSAGLIEREQDALGVTHAEISALVLERWMLPEDMVSAIRHHHDRPLPELTEPATKLAGIVGGSSDVARLLCEAPDKNIIHTVCTEAMQVVGLNVETLQHALEKIEPVIGELAEILRIDVIPSRVYSLIAETVAENLTTTAS
ncbi:MAG: HDOD domain-containing protein [Phycisphaerae bacterium]